MKRKKWLGAILVLGCLGTAINVHAQGQVLVSKMAEEDRYNPKYNMPIEPQAGEEQLDCVGISATELQQLEELLVKAWKNRESSVDVSKYNLTVSDEAYATCYWQILNNHPEMFYVDNNFGYTTYGVYAETYEIKYLMEQSESERIKLQMEAAADEALALVSDDMEDYEKALVVHDWLVNNCQYDYGNYLTRTISEDSHSAYGALVNGVAVCDGYSKAYQYIMDYKLGIDCYCITSDTIDHAWNLIEIGNQYYHVDATWDDPICTAIKGDKIGLVRHNNFLLSDNGITKTGHSGWETTVSAKDTTYDSAGNWYDTSGQVTYYNGKWYYVDDSAKSVVSTTDIFDGTATSLYQFDEWKYSAYSIWGQAFSYPQRYKNKLFFNGPKAIYSMDLSTNEVKVLFVPEITADTADTVYNIFGFDVKDKKLRYLISSNANLTGSETIQETNIPILGTIQGSVSIDGTLQYGSVLQAEVILTPNITEGIVYQWYRNGSLIETAVSDTYTLTKADIGKVIKVKVTVEEYGGEVTAQTDTVQKLTTIAPEETIAVTATRGQSLCEISLPAGYSWDEPDTVMTEAGVKTYGISYCPDEEICQTVTGLTATVTVVCQSHEWNSGTVTKPATLLENGIMEYQCKYCEATKEDAIPKLEDISNNTGNDTKDSDTTDNSIQGSENVSQNQDNEEAVTLKKGMTFTDTKTGNEYKITKVTKAKAEASFTGNTNKKKKSITIPATVKYANQTITVTSVAKNALKNNKTVTSVTVGKNVTSIGASAFQGCSKLKTITLKSTKIKSFGKNCVKNIHKKATIKCPKSSRKNYKAKLTKKTGFTGQMKLK